MRRHRLFQCGLRGLAAAAVLLAALNPSFVGRAGAQDDQAAIRGRIIDETGEGVPGQVVRLLKARSYLKMSGLRSLDQTVEETRVTTDALGFFEITTRLDPSFPYSYLRFYDPKLFDAVKYRLPEDREISKRLRSGSPVQATVSLRFQPDWPRIQALLEEHAPGSQVGQVLRSLGLPSSRAPEGPGRELWIYSKAKVAYVVEGSKVIETRALSDADVKAASGVDAPTPAVRVDTP